jgi:RHS repeat-associated protein
MSSIRCSEGSAWINRKKNSTDTGLYQVGAREYDPRTARWLQRDPIGVAGGHPNVYLYCLNQPVTRTDPSGQDCIVVFIHDTMSNDKTFSKEFMDHASKCLGAVAQYNYAWKSSSKPMASTANRYSIQGDEADTFKDFIENIPNPSGLPIVVIAHSNGGNVAAYAAQDGAPINAIVRLGSPPDAQITPQRMEHTIVFDVYDPKDTVVKYARIVGFQGQRHQGSCWYTIKVNAPASLWNFIPAGVEKHMNMHSIEVWNQLLKDTTFKRFAESMQNYKKP